MAKKKKNDGSGLILLPIAGLVAWAGWPSDFSKIIAGLLAIAGLGIIAFWTTEHVKYSRAVRRVDSKLKEVVESNIEALARRRSQLLQLDPYGNLKPEKWLKEIDYFISNNLFLGLDDYDRFIADERAPELTDYVESTVAAKTGLEPRHQAFRDEMTSIEYEHYCAEELKRSGWDARVTMASRDQGVDVIAQKSGIRLAVQCKLYRSPVGNKAVQEVVAARAHEVADYGIVVSNNSYTPAAQELARTNNVILLHHRDLAKIDKILGFPKEASERVFLHPASSSEEVPREAAFAEAVRPQPQSLTILFYTMAALVSAMIISIFLTRAPQNTMNSRSVQDQKHTAQKTQASSGTSAPSASSRGTPSISDVTAKDPSSPSEATAQTPSRSSPNPRTPPSATSRSNVEPAVEDGNKVSRMPQTGAAENAPRNLALALRCLPASAGDTTSIDISITGDKWTVRHRQKKGAAIERRAQYDILDTSRERELSWQGVHRRNRELKMVANLSHRSPNGTRIYKEELIDANVGRVMEMTAVCEDLRTWPTPPRRGH